MRLRKVRRKGKGRKLMKAKRNASKSNEKGLSLRGSLK